MNRTKTKYGRHVPQTRTQAKKYKEFKEILKTGTHPLSKKQIERKVKELPSIDKINQAISWYEWSLILTQDNRQTQIDSFIEDYNISHKQAAELEKKYEQTIKRMIRLFKKARAAKLKGEKKKAIEQGFGKGWFSQSRRHSFVRKRV